MTALRRFWHRLATAVITDDPYDALSRFDLLDGR
jgi:hypothetical protein